MSIFSLPNLETGTSGRPVVRKRFARWYFGREKKKEEGRGEVREEGVCVCLVLVADMGVRFCIRSDLHHTTRTQSRTHPTLHRILQRATYLHPIYNKSTSNSGVFRRSAYTRSYLSARAACYLFSILLDKVARYSLHASYSGVWRSCTCGINVGMQGRDWYGVYIGFVGEGRGAKGDDGEMGM
jgi:hypothetical protein